jgi:hypothetical protein
MMKTKVLSILLILCIWFSTVGFTAIPSTSAVSPLGPQLTAPGAFVKISPEDKSTVLTSKVILTWGASSGAVKYEYCLVTKQNCPPGQYKSVGNNTSVTLNLRANTDYWWQVRAYAADGSTTDATGGTWKFRSGSASPTAFSKLTPADTLSSNYPTEVTLTWAQSTGLNVNYQVCYGTTNTCTGTWIMVGPATIYTLKGLKYDTNYYWQVRAYNGKGTVYANAGTYWKFHTRVAPPTPFAKLAPGNNATGVPVNVNLVWSPSSGLGITYLYCIVTSDPTGSTCEAKGGAWTSTGVSTSVPQSLDYNVTYWWQVRALDTSGVNDPVEANSGTWFKFSTLIDPPSGFEKILPENGAANVSQNPYLYWSTSTGTGITYEYCVILAPLGTETCADGDYTSVNTSTSVKITTSLQNSKQYAWQVRARDAGDVLNYANTDTTWYFTTIPPSPTWTAPVSGFSTPEDPATPYTANLNDTATYSGNKSKLVYSISGPEPAGTLLLSSNGVFTYMPEANYNGSISFSFIIWDGVNNPSGPYTATISITAVNDTPVFAPPIADVEVFSGGDIFFTIETNDPDLQYGDSLTISAVGVPVGAIFTPAKDATTGDTSADFDWIGATWTTAHPGPYIVTVKIMDSLGAYTEDSFTITLGHYIVTLPIIVK